MCQVCQSCPRLFPIISELKNEVYSWVINADYTVHRNINWEKLDYRVLPENQRTLVLMVLAECKVHLHNKEKDLVTMQNAL